MNKRLFTRKQPKREKWVTKLTATVELQRYPAFLKYHKWSHELTLRARSS